MMYQKLFYLHKSFKERKKRQTLFHHRPNQLQGKHVEELVSFSNKLELVKGWCITSKE